MNSKPFPSVFFIILILLYGCSGAVPEAPTSEPAFQNQCNYCKLTHTFNEIPLDENGKYTTDNNDNFIFIGVSSEDETLNIEGEEVKCADITNKVFQGKTVNGEYQTEEKVSGEYDIQKIMIWDGEIFASPPVDSRLECKNGEWVIDNYYTLTMEVHGRDVYTGTHKKPEDTIDLGLILIVDMQQSVVQELGADRYGIMMPFILEVLDYANKNYIPIIITAYDNTEPIAIDKYSEDGTITGTVIIPPGIMGSTIVDIQNKVDENRNPYTSSIVKDGPDAVKYSTLLDELQKMKPLGIEPGDNGEYIYVMGLQASRCIFKTVESLKEKGYNVAVSFDTIANSEEVDEEDAEYSKWDWYFEKTKAAAFYWEVLNIPPPDWYADPGKTILDFRQIKLMEMASWGAQLLDYDSLPDAWTILRD
ncbi:MAG: cysteine hydrolase [Nanoarchaeota archaeon]|nr:cysteine hydrolase [Nanoarchaeota archaeon]